MIKFELRRNLIYPLQYFIWTFLRDILTMFIKHLFEFTDSSEYIPFMFIGEFFAGGIIYLYLKKIMPKKKEKKDQYFMAIKLINNEEDDNDYFAPIDNKIKIIILIFFAAFFDSISSYLLAELTWKFKGLSASLGMRLYGFATISASFTYVYALKLPVYRHHKFSLWIIGLCLIVIIVSEYFFQTINLSMTYGKLSMAFVYILFSQIFLSSLDSIEKYLFEYDYMNPFVVIMYEGLFGFLLNLFSFIMPDNLKDIKRIYYDKNKNFALFIFLLIVYIILSGLKNLYKVVSIKIYSPMTKMLTEYFLNPLYFPYYYYVLNDFRNKDDNIYIEYITLNFIIAFIISFFGFVYNEFIILFCCRLEYDTHYQISRRMESNFQMELLNFDDELDNNPENENGSLISKND